VLTDLTNVMIDQSVAAAAVSIDPAGNESRLSDPICVPRKLTNSFLDTCKASTSDNCGLNSCDIDPTGKGSALSAALFMLALAALIRRRGRA
jgi:MYXO-CTERM domain-containing protein